MTNTEKAILRTLAYSDIFRFPLKNDELWQFFINEKAINREQFEESLRQLIKEKIIVSKKGYYALAEHATDIVSRANSQTELQKKLQLAKRAAYYLSYIPTIYLIGISGSVAMGKATESDDIDLFIITKKNTLFMTRLWIQAILEMLHLRRKRMTHEPNNTICVNLLIDDSGLCWSEERRDIYTAHEILQMQPLFERNNMYSKFILANTWVKQFFPNAFTAAPQIPGNSWKKTYVSLRLISMIVMLRPFELLAKIVQKQYMKSHRTTETISNSMLAFHPIDYRSKIISNLNMKLLQLGLLTNK